MEKQSKYEVKCKLRKGDEVVVLTGRSRGQTGTIDRVDRKANKVYVGGVNLYVRHKKPDVSNPDGGIVEKPMPVDVSNVAFIDPKTKKASRLGYRMEDGNKVRFSKASSTVV